MVEDFVTYLRYEKHRSEKTVEAYHDDLRAFEVFFKQLDGGLSWKSVDADVIREWIGSMMDRGNAVTSVKRRLSAVRSLYRFALSRGLVEANPAMRVVMPKSGRPLPLFVRESEMNKLLDDVEWGDAYNDVLARTIFILLYDTGIRLAELIGLDDNDVDLSLRQLRVTGKGNKQRIVPFGEELRLQIEVYIEKRDAEVARVDDALLCSSRGNRVSRSLVYMLVKRNLAEVTTLKKRSPHVLRHSFATAMLNNEAGIESIQKLLGHERVATTEMYTHTTFEQLKKTYDKAHPRA